MHHLRFVITETGKDKYELTEVREQEKGMVYPGERKIKPCFPKGKKIYEYEVEINHLYNRDLTKLVAEKAMEAIAKYVRSQNEKSANCKCS